MSGEDTIPLGHVYKHIDVIVISLQVLVFDEPLDLLFDELLGRQKHVLEHLNEFRLESGVSQPLPHLHYRHDRLLNTI